MNTPDETGPDAADLLAAEFALGTLPVGDHAAIAARRSSEPALDEAIRAWEARLSPLGEMAADIEPPADLFQRVEQRLFGPAMAEPASEAADILMLRGRVKTWQRVAAGAMGLAAAIALVFGLREAGILATQSPDRPTSFVAMLQKDATSPAFVVSVDIETRQMTIRPVAAERADGKSYELWLVNKAFPSPRSLGIVEDRGRATEASLAKYSRDIVKDSILAVTLEPKGGAPNGSATGPVLFTGKLVQLTP